MDQYRQARQRQEDAKGEVSSATGVSYLALGGAALACGAAALARLPEVKMTNSPAPSAKRAETFRTVLGFVLVAAIAGVTLVLADFASALMDAGFQPTRLGWQVPLVTAIRLAAGFMMARIAYRGTRHGEMPSERAIVSVPALICLSILVDRLV